MMYVIVGVNYKLHYNKIYKVGETVFVKHLLGRTKSPWAGFVPQTISLTYQTCNISF